MYTRCGAFEDLHDNDCEDCLRDDEQLWTEYAKAALTGCLAYSQINSSFGNYQENASCEQVAFSICDYAEAMLNAHKKRWGHD